MNLHPHKQILPEDEKKIFGIYETYAKSMHDQAYKILNNSKEAELIVEESFLKIASYLSLFDLNAIKNRPAHHFIMTIVKHTAIDYRRKNLK